MVCVNLYLFWCKFEKPYNDEVIQQEIEKSLEISKGMGSVSYLRNHFLRMNEYKNWQNVWQITLKNILLNLVDKNDLSLFTEKRYRTPFLLCLVLMFIQQFSGCNFIAAYTVDIFEVSVNFTLSRRGIYVPIPSLNFSSDTLY